MKLDELLRMIKPYVLGWISGAGGGGGGGDATYLRLDAANDPVTGALDIEVDDEHALRISTEAARAYAVVAEISTGSITVTDSAGATISGLTPGNWYSVETTGGPWSPGAGYSNFYNYRVSNDGGSTWLPEPYPICLGQNGSGPGLTPTMHLDLPAWAEFAEAVDAHHARFYFQATTTSIKIRVAEDGPWGDNTGSLSWRLCSASITGGEVFNVDTETGETTVSGQLVSKVPPGTAPMVVASTTQVDNLNASFLEGRPASDFGGDILSDAAWTAKGQIIAATGAGAAAVIAPTANGQYPVADSGETTGIKWVDPATAPAFMVSVPGALVSGATEVGAFVAPGVGVFRKIYIRCKTPGSAGTTTIDCHKNGTTIFTTQANRPALAYNDADGIAVSGTPDVTAIAAGDLFTFYIDGVATDAAELVIVPAIDWTPSTAQPLPQTAFLFIDQFVPIAGCTAIVDNLSTSLEPYHIGWYQNGAGNDGDAIEAAVLLGAGTYDVKVRGFTSGNLGKIDWSIDGASPFISGQDWYSNPAVFSGITKTGSVTIASGGRHLVRATINGKNAASSDYFLYLAAVQFLRQALTADY